MNAPSKSSLPDRNTLAGGLTALLAWAIMLGLTKAGIVLPVEFQAMIPAALGWLINYTLPPSAKNVADRLNNAIVRLANADQDNDTTAVIVDDATSLAAAHEDMRMGLIPKAPLPPVA